MAKTSFTIQFLGTGNAWSKPPVNYNTNALVRVDGHAWLIDCGLLCPLALRDAGISQSTIDGIFISHLHGDHVLGLEELLYTNYFAYARRIRLWLPNAFIRAYSDVDGSDLWDNCLRASMETTVGDDPRLTTLDDYARVSVVYPQTTFDILGIKCEIFPTIHAGCKPSYGMILDDRVAFTSDCRFSPTLIRSLLDRGIETIFHEVTFEPPSPNIIHTSYEELATLPQEYASHLVLMHYSDLSSQNDFDKAEKAGFRIARRNIIYDFL